MRVGVGALWLVKSGGNILGPYGDRQVADLLRDRVIVPLDEISRPCARWIYIRDEPVFAKVVEELRLKNMRQYVDDTTTQNIGESTGLTSTITNSPSDFDDLTEDISKAVPQTAQDILFQSIDDVTSSASRAPKADAFIFEGDRFVQRQTQKTARWAWALTLVILLGAAGFVFYKKYVAQPALDRTLVEEKTQRGIEALEVGEYERALDLFKQAYLTAPNEKSLYLYLGILKIQVEGQAFQGRQLLEALLQISEKDVKRVWTGIGLAYIKEGNLQQAEKSFEKALDIDPLFDQAVINLGATALYQGDWAKASSHLLLARKDGSQDGMETLMLTDAYLHLYAKDSDKKNLEDALKNITDHLKSSRGYMFELKIAEAYIASLLSPPDSGQAASYSVHKSIASLLDMDFDESQNTRQNLFIHRDRGNWSIVSQWCLKMTHDLDPTAGVVALEGICLLKMGDIEAANRKVEDALLQAPKDPAILSAYSYVMRESNSMDRAVATIERALEQNAEKKLAQPYRLAGVLCQRRQDFDCEKRVWPLLLSVDSNSLPALAGLSRLAERDGNLAESKKYLLTALGLAKNYKPLFILNKMISRTEDRNQSRGL